MGFVLVMPARPEWKYQGVQDGLVQEGLIYLTLCGYIPEYTVEMPAGI